jgi:lysophospholipase L1-like esterase
MQAGRLATGNGVKLQRAAGVVLLAALGTLGGFVALEGASSLVLFVGNLLTFRAPTFNERLYTRYDPELGWVSRPNVSIPDMYGPGVFLKTNAQGFRADHDVAPEAPEGRARVICSGDSFTLGYGVDNDHTWCQRLAAIDPRLETVNMGQGGYGVDQAYLWYARDGDSLGHAFQLFAVITGDFFRMQKASFLGRGKPVLDLEDGKLVTRNVPVPELRWATPPMLQQRLAAAAAKLRTSQLVGTVRRRLSGVSAEKDHAHFDARTAQIAVKVFERLDAMNRARGSRLVVVYLPTWEDYFWHESDPWRAELRAASHNVGFAYLDLVPEFRELPLDRMKSLLIPAGSAGARHYSAAGHEWVADRLYAALAALLEPRLTSPAYRAQ